MASGCGATSATQKTVVRISNWGGAGEDSEYDRLANSFYERFEKDNPGVDVRVEGIPGEYVHKMLLNFVAGAQPDVMVLDASSAAVFIENGLLADLTPFIQGDPDFKMSDYFPNVADIARRGEKLYAIPGDFTPMVMYYNKRLFDQAGVPHPKPGWSFQEFLELAKKLTIHDGSGRAATQYGFYFPNWMPSWIMWLWNNGGDVLSPDGKRASGTLDSPQNAETIAFLRDLIQVHKVAPALSEAAAQGVDLFANGQAAMTVMGHWAIIGYKNAPKGPDGKPRIDWRELGVVELPHNTPESRTVLYEAGFAMPRGCKNPELAWKLIKMWTSYHVQSQYNASGIAICGRKDVAKERAAADPLERQFLPIVAKGRPPWGSRVEGYEVVEKIGKSMMDSVLLSGTPPEVALKRAAERIDLEFAKRQ
jgi:multiple sugar transport system substrate-binding protein